MSESGSNGAAAPQSSTPTNLLSGNKLTDFFMDGQPKAEPADPAQQQFTRPPKSVSEAEIDAQEGEEGPINAQQASVQEESEPEQEAGERGVLDALPDAKGQKDKPYALNDLPEDRFIEIKVDGDKEIVSLRELASGHIRRRAFNKFANTAKAAVDEARTIADGALNERNRVRERLHGLLTEPKNLVEWMLETQPEVLDKVARMYAEVWDGWQKDPDARRRQEWERQQKALAKERERFAAEKAQHERSMQETQAAQRELERLKPVVQRAMKEIGFPKVTPKFRETVNVMCEAARRTNGGKLDPEDLVEAIHAANKLHPAPGAVQERRPAAAPVAAPRARTEPRRNGGKDWNSVPYNRRMADPDFFLRRS